MASITIPEGASIQDTTRVVYDQPTPSTGPFNVPFPYFENANIKVYLDGVLQSEGAASNEYTLTGVEVDDGFTSGDVDFNDPITGEIIILRSVPVERTSDFLSSGPFPMSLFNVTLDKMFAILQQLRTTIDRTVRLNENDSTTDVSLPPAATRANQYLAFDSNGDPIVASATDLTSTAITPFGQTLIENPNAGDARTDLVVPGLLTTNTFTKRQTFSIGSDITSAATPTVVDDGNYYDVTGNVTIAGLPDMGDGTTIRLHFDGTPTLTHSATFFLPNDGNNIDAEAGDEATFVQIDSTPLWRCTNYERASGASLEPTYVKRGTYDYVRLSRWAATDNLSVTTTNIVVKNSSDKRPLLHTRTAFQNDHTTVGAGGMDTGSLSANTWYYVYAISGKGQTDSCITSLSSTAPALPSLYTHYAFIGAFRTNGTSNIINFTQENNNFVYEDLVTIKNGSWVGGVWTEITVSDFYPDSARKIMAVQHADTASRFSISTYDNGKGGEYYVAAGATNSSFDGVFANLYDHTRSFEITYVATTIWYYASSSGGAELVAVGWSY